MTDMPANQDPPRPKPITSKPITPRPALGAGVLVIFLLLHIVAVALLRGAGTQDGAQATPVSTLQSTD
jgi:hypothetical protein